MIETRAPARLAGRLLFAVAAITIVVSGPSVSYAQAPSPSSGAKVSFQVVAAPTTTLPTATTTTAPAPSVAPAQSSPGAPLAFTGGSFGELALIAAGLAATGALLVAAARRRPTGPQC